jgi:hypothetical protein
MALAEDYLSVASTACVFAIWTPELVSGNAGKRLTGFCLGE